MSGQPYKTPMDMAKARQAYLANLKLRAELDDKNFQANKIYVKTGQLPVEPTDTRTLTEKLADVQRLKIEMASKLLEITDGENAQAIMNDLDETQITFLAQNFEPIKEQIKKMYSKGVLAPLFIDYLQRYMDKYAETRGVELGLQQSSANQLIANQQVIYNTLPKPEDYAKITQILNQLAVSQSNYGRSLQRNIEDLKNITNNLPQVFDILNKENNEITKNQILDTITDVVDELPSRADIERSLAQLEINIRSSNLEGVKSSLIQLRDLTETGSDIAEQVAILNKLLGISILQPSSQQPSAKQPSMNLTTPDASAKQPSIMLPSQQIAKATILPDLTPRQIEIQNKYRPTNSNDINTNDKKLSYIREMAPYLINDEDGRPLNMLKDDADVPFSSYRPWIKSLYNREPNVINKTELTDAVSRINRGLRILGWGDENVLGLGKGIKGKGIIKRIRPSQVFETDIDHKVGIRPTPKFAQIGRYLINKRQLDKDIIAIKRPAGSTISNLPSQRVSKNLGNVIRKIVGNGVPTFDELSSLTDEEKLYLHKVAKESRIEDKLNIPTPKKDEDEKDINQFEILKGQILAGNDNLELVKKFKTIILKLSKKDLIPRSQVKDLLLDLATLGH